MASAVVPMCNAAAVDRSFQILNIGLGGGDIPAFLLSHCPNTTLIESVEYDPRVVTVAGKFFGTGDSHGRHTVDTGDGGARAAALLKSGRRFDAVLVDVFDDAGDVPATCLGDVFTTTIHGLLKPSGKLVQQVWDRQHSSLLSSFKKQFGSRVEDGDSSHGQWVVVATKES
jgi:spermidine synthase